MDAIGVNPCLEHDGHDNYDSDENCRVVQSKEKFWDQPI